MTWALGRLALGATVAVVLLVLLTPTGAGLSTLSPAAPPPRTAQGSPSAHPGAPRPAFTCPPPIQLPTYSPIGGFLPPVPGQSEQLCGNSVDQDTIHATFSSPHPYSGERFTEPIYLPTTGSPGPAWAYNDFEIGMVLAGDPASADRQSFGELYFTPTQSAFNATVSWGVSFAVWSMHNFTQNSNGSGGCWTLASEVVWENSYWCVQEMMNVTSAQSGPSGIPGGTWYNVTFDGLVGNATGLRVWANDSTDPVPADNYSVTLNTTTTQTLTFEPYYNASCVDACYLNWSFPYGLGIGWDVCPIGSPAFASCDSYNQTEWDGIPSAAFGIPTFWQNATAGYGGQYEYLAVVTGSAECATGLSIPLASCGADESSSGGTGFYPYFSWNGSQLNFGDGDHTPSYTVEDLGGEYFEYIQTGPYQKDLPVSFVDRVTNDSHGGYVRPGHALNVTAYVSDLGTIRSVHLNYTLNSGAVSTIAMPRTGGSAQRGAYTGEVPVGANGWINYTITVVSDAPYTLVTHTYHVYRGPLPTFDVVVNTYPTTYRDNCTTVTVNGTVTENGTMLLLEPGTYPVTSASCFPFQFSRYGANGSLGVTPWNGTATNLTVSGDGALDAVWVYVRPHVTVNFTTAPSGCGGVTIDNTSVVNGGFVSVLYGFPIVLGALQGCGGKVFSGWTFVGNFSILGSRLTPGGNGTLTANFVPSTSASAVTFDTSPQNCGGVVYRGVGYTNGETLEVNSTPYPVAPLGCSHYGFEDFLTTGGASISNANLTVTSSGTVTDVDYVLTEVTVLTYPAYCTVDFDEANYGNGSVIVVSNNSTHSVSQNPCAGHYAFSLTSTPGLSVFGSVLTVNDSGSLIATWLPGSAPSSFVEFETDPGTCGAIGFLGATWYNTNFTNVAANTTGTISALSCPNYGFVRWQPTGGITVPSRYSPTSTVYVNGSGSLEAVFRPTVSVAIQTTPTDCGTVAVNGVAYANNGTADLTQDVAYPVQATPCAHYSFVSWGNSIGAIVANGTVYLTGQAILTANFALTIYNVSVSIGPKACGSIYVNGASETNGSVASLPYGTYSLATSPCVGDVVSSVVASSNLTISGNHLTINGNGTLVATYVPVPPQVTLSLPSASIAGDAVEFTATVGVLIPPFTYTYTWTFGDGTTLTTPANFTEHTYASPGTYHVSVVVQDPLNRTANASETVSILAANSGNSGGVPGSTLVILGILGLVAVALLAVALWRRRPPATSPDPSSPSYPVDDDAGSPEVSEGMGEAPPSGGPT